MNGLLEHQIPGLFPREVVSGSQRDDNDVLRATGHPDVPTMGEVPEIDPLDGA